MNDTGNTGELLAEATTFGTSVDPVISAITFGAYKMSSKPIILSPELLEDSAFNLSLELGRGLGIRIGRVLGTYTTTGTGSAQPQGIVIGASLGKTAAAATSYTPEELIDLQASLDPAYETFPSLSWMMSKAQATIIRKFRIDEGGGAGTGQFLWQPGLQAGQPDMLLGSPILIVQEMPAATAGLRPIVYGAMEFFVIRDAGVMRLQVLRELFAQTDQIGFVAFSRHDSKVIQPAAIKALQMAP
jgi:HK97 family phage major capsid protein